MTGAFFVGGAALATVRSVGVLASEALCHAAAG